MKQKIKVFIKRPGENPYSTHISNTLMNLQAHVDGYIEGVRCKDFCIICNEEGILLNLPYNCTIEGNMYFGTIIFVGETEDYFDDVGISFEDFKAKYGGLFK